MDKFQVAHDWAIELLRSGDHSDDIISCAWRYADAMQAEADKRNHIVEPTEKVGEWQPDWSQAPEWANWWAVDEKSKWFAKEPRIEEDLHVWGVVGHLELAPSFNYQGDWRNSLRSRP